MALVAEPQAKPSAAPVYTWAVSKGRCSMIRPVTLNEAQIQLRVLIEAVKSGDTVIIVQNDQPVVQLTAVSNVKRHTRFENTAGQVIIADDFDAPCLTLLSTRREFAARH